MTRLWRALTAPCPDDARWRDPEAWVPMAAFALVLLLAALGDGS